MKKNVRMSAVLLAVFGAMTLTANGQNLLFLSHYDGNTNYGGMNADFAVGSADVGANGGSIGAGKFGAGSMDTSSNSGGGNNVTYGVAGNINADTGTLDMWIQTDAWGTQNDTNGQGLLSIWNNPAWSGGIFMKQANSKLTFTVSDAMGANWYEYATPVLAVDSAWHHVAFDWDLPNGHIGIYLDGVSQSLTQIGGGWPVDAYDGTWGAPMEIGTIQGGWNPHNGLIDELRILDGPAYNGVDFTPPTEAYVVPEPATLALLSIGGLFLRRRARKE